MTGINNNINFITLYADLSPFIVAIISFEVGLNNFEFLLITIIPDVITINPRSHDFVINCRGFLILTLTGQTQLLLLIPPLWFDGENKIF